jgi:hypothetical protein
MADGVNAMADSVAPGYLNNILHTHADSTYSGTEFAQSPLSASVTDVSIQNDTSVYQEAISGIDSINPLGNQGDM